MFRETKVIYINSQITNYLCITFIYLWKSVLQGSRKDVVPNSATTIRFAAMFVLYVSLSRGRLVYVTCNIKNVKQSVHPYVTRWFGRTLYDPTNSITCPFSIWYRCKIARPSNTCLYSSCPIFWIPGPLRINVPSSHAGTFPVRKTFTEIYRLVYTHRFIEWWMQCEVHRIASERHQNLNFTYNISLYRFRSCLLAVPAKVCFITNAHNFLPPSHRIWHQWTEKVSNEPFSGFMPRRKNSWWHHDTAVVTT